MSRGPLYSRIAPTLARASRGLGVHRRTLRRPIVVRRVRVPAGLGLRIVLLADIHADSISMPATRVREAVELVNGIDDVDLVAMPGDFVGHELPAVEWTAVELERIEAPMFATLGNHDHMEGPDRICELLAARGIRVLVDEAIQPDPERWPRLWIAGLDSTRARVPAPGSVEAMLPNGASGHEQAQAQCVVLGHEPWLATRHAQLLHLAGHTHHGQIRLPGLPPLYLPRHSRPFPAGLATVSKDGRDRYIYTTAGLGSTTIPMRIGAPSEIVVLDC